MKKAIFLMAVALFAMTSCTKEETLQSNPGQAIDFRAAMGTRVMTNPSDQVSTTALSTPFYATALYPADHNPAALFEDALFTKQTSGNYASTQSYYWPSDNTELKFWAYAPSKTDLGGTLAFTNTEATLTDFQRKEVISEQQDFILATAEGQKSTHENTGVQLAFEHKLAQIGVMAIESNTTYTYEIAGVRIGKVTSKGTFTDNGTSTRWFTTGPVSTGSWAASADNANYEVLFPSAITLTDSKAAYLIGKAADAAEDAQVGESHYAMLIPHTLTSWDKTSSGAATNGAYLAVKLQVKETNGGKIVLPQNGKEGDYCWVAASMPEGEWVAGKKYIYTLDFTEGNGLGAPQGDKMPEGGSTDPDIKDEDNDGYVDYVKPEEGTEPDPETPVVPKPGDEVLGNPINFVSVTINDWVDGTENPETSVTM